MGIHFTEPLVQTRQIRMLRIEAGEFLHLLRALDGKKALRLKEPLPEDARCVGFSVDECFNTVTLYIESETFPPRDPATVVEEINLTVESWQPLPEEQSRWWVAP